MICIHNQSVRLWYLFLSLVLSLIAAFVASLAWGSTSLADQADPGLILHLRLQRSVVAALAGAALAVAGVLTQGLFRNPLAGPSVLGVNAGAALGGQVAMLCLGALGLSGIALELVVPFACVLGAAVALLCLLIGVRLASNAMLTILLIGIMLSSLFASFGALATSIAQEEWQLGRAMIYFSMGGLEGKAWIHASIAGPFIIAGILAACFWASRLNVWLAGEEEAASLGVKIKATRLALLCWSAVLAAMAVAIGGGVLFVGLIVPNVLRAWCRSDHRLLVPAAALAGASFLLACDVLTRLFPSRGVIPLGVVTGLIGAPLFILILLRQQRVLAR